MHENFREITDLVPRYDYEYNYSFILFFEKKYYSMNYIEMQTKWLTKWWWLSIVYSFIYIILVYGGQKLMKNREKFHLYRSLVGWNIVLAIFSIMGAIRFLPNFFAIFYNKGVVHTICKFDYNFGISGCWAWLFVLSKVAELIDTAFIVLRKQKLIFLHWYHHATVLVYCWYSVHGLASSGRWFVAMNYFVHAIMYSYYAFRAMRFSIPKYINIIITSLQISQMVIGIVVNSIAYYKKNRGEKCDVSYDNIYWSFFMYFTYFLLFFHFFRNAYLKKASRAQEKIDLALTKKNNAVGKDELHDNHFKKQN
jgi:elongation of very long chain fatty acids protein 6